MPALRQLPCFRYRKPGAQRITPFAVCSDVLCDAHFQQFVPWLSRTLRLLLLFHNHHSVTIYLTQEVCITLRCTPPACFILEMFAPWAHLWPHLYLDVPSNFNVLTFKKAPQCGDQDRLHQMRDEPFRTLQDPTYLFFKGLHFKFFVSCCIGYFLSNTWSSLSTNELWHSEALWHGDLRCLVRL